MHWLARLPADLVALFSYLGGGGFLKLDLSSHLTMGTRNVVGSQGGLLDTDIITHQVLNGL